MPEPSLTGPSLQRITGLTKKVLTAMTPSPCVKSFELTLCSLMPSPVDNTGLRQRKTERWNGITPMCALIDGRYGEKVSRPQATREQDCRKSECLG